MKRYCKMATPYSDRPELIGRPVYTKDEEYVGEVVDIDKENSNNLIIKGRNDLRKYSIHQSLMISFHEGKVLLDMARDDFTEYEI